MADHNKVLNKIEKIKEAMPNPSCYLLALIITSEFRGQILYNSDHCISKIGRFYFDKRGLVSPREVFRGDYIPLKKYDWDQELALIGSLEERLRGSREELQEAVQKTFEKDEITTG